MGKQDKILSSSTEAMWKWKLETHSEIISSHYDAIISGPGYESMMVSVYFGFVIYVGRGGIKDLTPYQALSEVCIGNHVRILIGLSFYI